MDRNKDNYKKAINQIHASEDLKEKTFEKIINKKSNKFAYMKFLSACAVFVIVFSLGYMYVNKENDVINNVNPEDNQTKTIAKSNINLPRFESMQELKDVLKENTVNDYNESIKADATLGNSREDVKFEGIQETAKENQDYSKTNVQVENVDEADIVKTDGEHIYYITNNKVYIVSSDNLEKVSEIQIKTDKEYFSPNELYINNNKLIVLGNNYAGETDRTITNGIEDLVEEKLEVGRVVHENLAKAIVYDISNKENPKVIREVALEGNYTNSRMIGDDIYFISRKYTYYSDNLEDNELLPMVKDTAGEEKIIDCRDIAYFKDTKSYSYTLVGGFNINNNQEMNVETFFGAGDEIYCSNKNLYITQTEYKYEQNETTKTTIYKFALDNSNIVLQCKGEVKGYLNNQFSMDEYDGNLRLATTYSIIIKPQEEKVDEKTGIATTTIAETTDSNILYILDENLKEIGKIEDLAKDEKIYSVRFIGKIGYIVTFRQIDPLFVIDLSDPTNPQIKGELKIPGYSSYLHPYDETHIIGIGYNTKDNGYGGITNSNMKMSMFDVSDLENPKEIFNISIGGTSAYSNVLYNHKVLFYNKSKNLIGFPVTLREYRAKDDRDGFVLYKINLEKNEFEKYGEILQKIDYRTNIDRAIYIKDTLYTLSDTKIVSYDLITFEKIKELDLGEKISDDFIME